MANNLPEGFELIGQDTTSLPEGFELVPNLQAGKDTNVPDMAIDVNFGSSQPTKMPNTYNADVTATVDPLAQQQSEIALQTKQQGQDIVANVENIQTKYSTMLKQVKGVWNKEAREQAKIETESVKQEVVNELARKGFQNPTYNQATNEFTVEKDGMIIPVDSNFLIDLKKSGLEAGGAIVGGMVGSLGGPAGMVAGSATGASLGRTGDILANQIDLVKKVDDKFILSQATEAGLFDLGATAVGTAIVKPIAATARWLDNIYKNVKDGNIDGAYSFALNHYGVSENEARDLVTKFEQLAGEVEGTDKEKVLRVLAMSREGGEDIISKANLLDPQASSTVAKQIFDRSKSLMEQTKNLSADNVQHIVQTGLDNYTSDVKSFYNKVKTSGDEFTQGYTFDYDATGLQPLLAKIGADIKDPVVDQRFASLLTRIRDTTEGRTFTDLIDLRQAVNDVKYSSNTLSRSDAKSLDTVLESIDNEIKRAADIYIPQSENWLKSWDLAKREYSTMKKLENNVLFKALTRPGIDESKVVNLLSKYISAGDNTFFEVVDKLPKNVRNRIDGAILDNMVEKYSAGKVGGNRATNFPMLSQELQKMRWTSPQAKQTVRTINRMAEVFKNDVNLARVSGNIELPRFQSYLTTDPVVRLKFEVASGIFNYIRQLMPGGQSEALALIKHTARLMEDPLSNKAITDMMRALPKDKRQFRDKLNFDETLSSLRNEYANRQMKLKELYGKDAPPRLTWSKPLDRPTRILDSVDDILYVTAKGTIANEPSTAIMRERSDDIISDFIWQATTKDIDNTRIVEQASKYMDNNRFDKLISYTRGQLRADERQANKDKINQMIQREADILIKRINADFGVQLPKEEANKILQYKIKEMLKDSK